MKKDPKLAALLISQLILGGFIVVGLVNNRLWKTAIVEIARLAFTVVFVLKRRGFVTEEPVARSIVRDPSAAVIAVGILADLTLLLLDRELGMRQ